MQLRLFSLLQNTFLLSFLLCVGSMEAGPTDHPELRNFHARAELIIERVAEHGVRAGFWGGGKYGAYPAMAQFAVGNVRLGRQFARQQLTGSGAMFREFGNMALYMKYRDLYDDELCELVKDNQLHHSALYAPGERGDLPGASENHKLMYAVANYLGGRAWPQEYPKAWYQAGYDYLIYWFDEVTGIGFWEEDSPTYLVHHLGPIFSVLEFAPEGSEMKRKAQMVYEWYLASITGEYLKGYWITSSARDYVPVHGMRLSEESAAAIWLYFGDSDGRVPDPAPSEGHPPFIHWLCAVHMATSDYQPPRILVRIATDRDEAYVHREFMRRNPMRPREYAFITPQYGLAAVLAESERIPPDMTRWKLQWVPRKQEAEPSVFLLKHPSGEGDKWKRWRNASPYEQVFQHKGTLLALYNIPEDDPHPFIDGPLEYPVYSATAQRDGWWFFHTGPMLFGIYATGELYETDEKRTAYQHYGKMAEVKVLRSDGRRKAVIVQTAPLDPFEGGSPEAELASFSKAVLDRTRLKIDVDGDQPQLRYRNLAGDTIYVQYDGLRKVNEQVFSTDDWPLLENPWMHQDVHGGNLVLRHRTAERMYDFDAWTVQDLCKNLN